MYFSFNLMLGLSGSRAFVHSDNIVSDSCTSKCIQWVVVDFTSAHVHNTYNDKISERVVIEQWIYLGCVPKKL
jgi:hypothetical protein